LYESAFRSFDVLSDGFGGLMNKWYNLDIHVMSAFKTVIFLIEVSYIVHYIIQKNIPYPSFNHYTYVHLMSIRCSMDPIKWYLIWFIQMHGIIFTIINV